MFLALLLPSLPAGAATPPTAVTLVSPSGTLAAGQGSATYRWNATSNATHYFLGVKNKTTNAMVIQSWYTGAQAGCPGTTGVCAATPGITLAAGNYSWYVLTYGAGGYGPTAPGSIQWLSFTVSSQASTPGSATPQSPSGAITETVPSFTWSSAANTTHYRVVASGANGKLIDKWYSTSEASCASGQATCSVSPQVTFPTGAGSWTIATFNSAGSVVGPTSTATSFTVTAAAPAAPGNVTPVSPSGAIATASPAYTWNASSNTTHYRLIVTGSGGGVIDQNLTAAAVGCSSGSGSCTTTPATTLTTGSYQWTVTPSNSNGSQTTTGTASAATAFTYTAPPATPGTVTLTSPSGTIASASPAYTWNASSNTTHYRLIVTGSGGSVIDQSLTVAAVGCSSGSGSCTTTPATTLTAGSYQWTITPSNSDGSQTTTGTTTAATTFTYVPPPATPGAVTLVSPSGSIVTATPTYTWNASSDTTQYRLQVTGNSGILIEQTVTAAAAGCTGGGTCTTTPATSLSNGNYQWTILPQNNDGTQTVSGATSGATAFTVAAPPATPGTPTPVSPSGAITESRPTYGWNAVSNATHYLLEVTDSTGSGFAQTLTAASVGCSSGSGTCTSTPAFTLAQGAGSWRVTALNTVGDLTTSGSASTSLAFTLVPPATAPGATTLLSPAGTVAGPQLLFQWQAVNGSDYYFLRLAQNGVLVIDEWLTAAEANCPTGAGTCSHAPAFAVAEGSGEWFVLTYSIAAGYGPKDPGTFERKKITVAYAIHVAINNVNEGTATPVSLGNLTMNDGSAVARTYTIEGGADAASFEIVNGDELWIKAGVTLDRESDPSLEVIVTATGVDVHQTLSITVNNLNEAPTALALSASGIDENTTTTSAVTLGTLTTTDPDQGDTATYAITGGADAATFEIAGDALKVVAGATLDHEVKDTLAVEVTVTDSGGLSLVQPFSLTVNDLNEAPTGLALSGQTIAENADLSQAAALGTLSASDQDTGQTLTYTISGGADQSLFQLDGATLKIAAGTTLSHASKPTLEVEITVRDDGSPVQSQVQTFAISVTAAKPITLSTSQVDENTDTSANVVLGTLSADGNGIYTVVGGTDQASFLIQGSTLLIKAGTTLDFETRSTLGLQVQSSDAQGNFSQNLTIQVNDLPEAPTDITIDNDFLPLLDRPDGATIGTLSATDQDAGESFTYTLTDDQGGRFAVSGDALQVVDSPTTVHGTFTVTVRVTDKDALTFEKALTLRVIGISGTTIPATPTVATLVAAAPTTYGRLYKALAEAAPGGSVTVTETDLMELIAGKAAHQLTPGGSFSQSFTEVVRKLVLDIKPTLITATLEVGVIDAIMARLPASVQSTATTLFDLLAPYATDYTAVVRIRVSPAIDPLDSRVLGFNQADSVVEVMHENASYLPDVTFGLATLITNYNNAIADLKTGGLWFFSGGGSTPPSHFLHTTMDESLATERETENATLNLGQPPTDDGQAVPLAQRVDYYFPGLVSSITIQDGAVVLTR
ncbi:MAG: cadherin repeat domain-containing protein [Magnetococcales bacterium]|nr:cadherin repeat domain-containing protein [Magnetococcales bacterium]